MTTFKKTCTAALAALTLSGAVLASAAPVEAGFGRRHGGAIAAGVVGGFALGAAIASQRPAYSYAPVLRGLRPGMHRGLGGRLRRLRPVLQAARADLPLISELGRRGPPSAPSRSRPSLRPDGVALHPLA